MNTPAKKGKYTIQTSSDITKKKKHASVWFFLVHPSFVPGKVPTSPLELLFQAPETYCDRIDLGNRSLEILKRIIPLGVSGWSLHKRFTLIRVGSENDSLNNLLYFKSGNVTKSLRTPLFHLTCRRIYVRKISAALELLPVTFPFWLYVD